MGVMGRQAPADGAQGLSAVPARALVLGLPAGLPLIPFPGTCRDQLAASS